MFSLVGVVFLVVLVSVCLSRKQMESCLTSKSSVDRTSIQNMTSECGKIYIIYLSSGNGLVCRSRTRFEFCRGLGLNFPFWLHQHQ